MSQRHMDPPKAERSPSMITKNTMKTSRETNDKVKLKSDKINSE